MGRSLHNLSPSLGLACKSFLISNIFFHLFSHRSHNSCYSRSTHSSWTPCNSVALGEIVSSKVLCFHIFWLLITPLHLKSHYFTTASSRLERVTQRDTSKASLTAVNILFLFLPPRALLRLFGNNNLHLSFRGW